MPEITITDEQIEKLNDFAGEWLYLRAESDSVFIEGSLTPENIIELAEIIKGNK